MSASTQHVDTSETSPLLNANGNRDNGPEAAQRRPRGALPTGNPKARMTVWTVLTLLFILMLVILLKFQDALSDGIKSALGILPTDPMNAAHVILAKAPVIDGHIDLPMLARFKYANNVSAIDLAKEMPGQVDIPRLRKGKVGGFFWSTYVECPDPAALDRDFLNPTWLVRDTLEQIDVAKLLIAKYPDTFALALTSEDVKNSIVAGKIASLLGVEGAHQLGNSIAVMRQYYELGIRYITLTHSCHNAFADSCGYLKKVKHHHGGLTHLGQLLIEEMNRVGMLVDLSHTSDDTAIQALRHTKAPVIWSHSSARAIYDVPRNVPDDVLKLVGLGENKTDAVVMVNFVPDFIAAPGKATVQVVADHVEHIATVTGKEHVGLGSDFDGIDSGPEGLEDVSKYPELIAELYRRNWTQYELAGLTGGNLLRVMEGTEKVAKVLQSRELPIYDLYSKRKDIPGSV